MQQQPPSLEHQQLLDQSNKDVEVLPEIDLTHSVALPSSLEHHPLHAQHFQSSHLFPHQATKPTQIIVVAPPQQQTTRTTTITASAFQSRRPTLLRRLQAFIETDEPTDETGSEEDLFTILKKPMKSNSDCIVIEERTAEYKLFKQIHKHHPQVHRRIAKYLTFEFVPKGRAIYYQSDHSDSLYILLKGRALTLTKNQQQPLNVASPPPSIKPTQSQPLSIPIQQLPPPSPHRISIIPPQQLLSQSQLQLQSQQQHLQQTQQQQQQHQQHLRPSIQSNTSHQRTNSLTSSVNTSTISLVKQQQQQPNQYSENVIRSSNVSVIRMLRIRQFQRFVKRVIRIQNSIRCARQSMMKSTVDTALALFQKPSNKRVTSKEEEKKKAMNLFAESRFQKLRREILSNFHCDFDIEILENPAHFFAAPATADIRGQPSNSGGLNISSTLSPAATGGTQPQLLYSVTSSLREGDSFGEAGLLKRAARESTVICLTNCYLAKLSKEHYLLTLQEINQQRVIKRSDFILQSLFPVLKLKTPTESNIDSAHLSKPLHNTSSSAGTPRSAITTATNTPKASTTIENTLTSMLDRFSQFRELFQKSKYPAGHFLAKQGSVIDSIHLIKKGEVTCLMAQPQQQQPFQLAVLGKYEIVNAHELFKTTTSDQIGPTPWTMNSNQPITSRLSYQVKSHFCSVESIRIQDLISILHEFPEINKHLQKAAETKRSWIETRLKSLSYTSPSSIHLIHRQKRNRKMTTNSSSVTPANHTNNQSETQKQTFQQSNFASQFSSKDPLMLELLSPSSVITKRFFQPTSTISNEPVSSQTATTTATTPSLVISKTIPSTKNNIIQPFFSTVSLDQQPQSHQQVQQQQQPQQQHPQQKSSQNQKQDILIDNMISEYCENELAQIQTSDQFVKESTPSNAVEEVLALKYGFLHSISSSKLQPRQVMDFIFNHEETNQQKSILSSAISSKATFSEVISANKQFQQQESNNELKRKRLKKAQATSATAADNQLMSIPSNHKPVSEVKVDYSTLVYSQELLEKLRQRQNKTNTDNLITLNQPAETGKTRVFKEVPPIYQQKLNVDLDLKQMRMQIKQNQKILNKRNTDHPEFANVVAWYGSTPQPPPSITPREPKTISHSVSSASMLLKQRILSSRQSFSTSIPTIETHRSTTTTTNYVNPPINTGRMITTPSINSTLNSKQNLHGKQRLIITSNVSSPRLESHSPHLLTRRSTFAQSDGTLAPKANNTHKIQHSHMFQTHIYQTDKSELHSQQRQSEQEKQNLPKQIAQPEQVTSITCLQKEIEPLIKSSNCATNSQQISTEPSLQLSPTAVKSTFERITTTKPITALSKPKLNYLSKVLGQFQPPQNFMPDFSDGGDISPNNKQRNMHQTISFKGNSNVPTTTTVPPSVQQSHIQPAHHATISHFSFEDVAPKYQHENQSALTYQLQMKQNNNFLNKRNLTSSFSTCTLTSYPIVPTPSSPAISQNGMNSNQGQDYPLSISARMNKKQLSFKKKQNHEKQSPSNRMNSNNNSNTYFTISTLHKSHQQRPSTTIVEAAVHANLKNTPPFHNFDFKLQ